MTLIQKKKGVSTFIAALLMMVLAVSAGVVIYSYTMGYLGGLGGTSTQGAMSLDATSCLESTDNCTAYVRNIGKGSIALDKAYVDGVQVPDNNFTATPSTISEGQVAEIQIHWSAFAAPKTYEIKLVAEDNTQLSFTVKCK